MRIKKIRDVIQAYKYDKIVERDAVKELLDLHSVMLRDLLNGRLEENERNLNEAWENLKGESVYKNIDNVSPFFNQVQLYKAKITELKCIIENL